MIFNLTQIKYITCFVFFDKNHKYNLQENLSHYTRHEPKAPQLTHLYHNSFFPVSSQIIHLSLALSSSKESSLLSSHNLLISNPSSEEEFVPNRFFLNFF